MKVTLRLIHKETKVIVIKEYDVPNLRRNFAVCAAFELLRNDPTLVDFRVRHFRTRKSPQ